MITHLATAEAVGNPAFDVTPHELVSAIITEAGVLKAPYTESVDALRKRYEKK